MIAVNIKRKETRLDISLSSSIKGTGEAKRNFCIIRNVSRKGVYLTTQSKFIIGQTVECIMSFNEKSINFFGIIRRADQTENGIPGYGIEIIELSENGEKELDDFVNKGYLPGLEE